jgi:hypothetical protein
LRSSDVLENAFVLLVTLNVASFDQLFDALFYLSRLWFEPDQQMFGCFHDEVGIVNLATSLHDFDDGSLDLVPTIIFDLSLHAEVVLLLHVL